MNDIVHKMSINAPIEKIYSSISTMDGLKAWLTSEVEGTYAEGNLLSVNILEWKLNIEVLELIENEFVKWRCTDGLEEWKGTVITFELEEKNGSIEVFFGHSGWSDQTEFFAHCNTSWAVFLLNLKNICENGEGHLSSEI